MIKDVFNNFKITIKDSRGFTAAELVVAMTLIGLLVGFSFKAYLYFQTNFVNWQQRVSLEETGRRIIGKVADDLLMLRKVVNAQKSSLSFIDFNGKVVTYEYTKQNILRNSRALLKKSIIAEKMQFYYFTANDNMQDIIDAKNINQIQILLILKNKRQAAFELVTTVTLRNKRLF